MNSKVGVNKHSCDKGTFEELANNVVPFHTGICVPGHLLSVHRIIFILHLIATQYKNKHLIECLIAHWLLALLCLTGSYSYIIAQVIINDHTNIKCNICICILLVKYPFWALTNKIRRYKLFWYL